MAEKIATFIANLFWALYERFKSGKADQEHADAVRADPGAHWLRRFGGKDIRENSAGSGNAGDHSD